LGDPCLSPARKRRRPAPNSDGAKPVKAMNVWDEGRLRTAARTATTAMRLLRYLRRPAALKIVSSETLGSPSFLSFTPTRRHKVAFGTSACPGTPLGKSSLIARRARSNAGWLLCVAPVREGRLGGLALAPGGAQFRNVGAEYLDPIHVPKSWLIKNLASDPPWAQRTRLLPIQILRF